jgi:hypothetical protein
MRSTTQIFALLAAPILSSAQTFLPTGASGNFPACAASCALLQQIETTCLTQTGQQATGLAAENCFCQSGSLQPLYSTPDAICTAECTSETDRGSLRTWFTSFCAQVGQGVDPNASTATTATPTTGATTGTNTNAPTATSGGSAIADQHRTSGSQSWYDRPRSERMQS